MISRAPLDSPTEISHRVSDSESRSDAKGALDLWGLSIYFLSLSARRKNPTTQNFPTYVLADTQKVDRAMPQREIRLHDYAPMSRIADYLGVSKSTIARHRKDGKLDSVRIGQSLQISRVSLEKYLKVYREDLSPSERLQMLLDIYTY